MSEIFIIPTKPVYDERGFVLLPIMPEGSISGKSCLMCSNGHNCKPDRHHAYWPKRRNFILEAMFSHGKHKGLPDISKRPYDALRNADFSLSKLACRSWHDAMHHIQSPPRHLPDPDLVELALEQHRLITNINSRSKVLNELVRAGNHSAAEKVQSTLISMNMNFPREIIFPTVGYYCLVGSEEAEAKITERPSCFEVEPIRDCARLAIDRCQVFLESAN